jgi:hypothetical protein
MHAFELNTHGKLVFPANCFPDLDFSTLENLEQLTAVIQRDSMRKRRLEPTSWSGSRPGHTRASSS